MEPLPSSLSLIFSSLTHSWHSIFLFLLRTCLPPELQTLRKKNFCFFDPSMEVMFITPHEESILGFLSIVKKDFTMCYFFFFFNFSGWTLATISCFLLLKIRLKEKGLCYSVNFCLLLKSKVFSQTTSSDNNSKWMWDFKYILKKRQTPFHLRRLCKYF